MLIDITTEYDPWSKSPEILGLIKNAAFAAIAGHEREFENRAELSILLTCDETVRRLNATYRGFDKPTNVLSFPGVFEARTHETSFLLGDIVLGYQTIKAEAGQQHISFKNHVCHLIVHGVLHLLGHDHEDDQTASAMENTEIKILKGIGIENPYVQKH